MAMPEMGAPKQMSAVAQMVGDWDVSLIYRMAPADAWTTSKGNSTMEMVLNGCALQEHMTLDMMSMTVGDFVDGKLVMMGDDMQGGMPFKMRNSSHIVRDDEIVFSMEMSVDGGATWFDSMGITYTRAK